MDDKKITVYTPEPYESMLTIMAPDGRKLLVWHADGTVEGDVEDMPEAARVLVEEVRKIVGQQTKNTIRPAITIDGATYINPS